MGLLAVNPTDCNCFAQLARLHGMAQHSLFHAQLYGNETFFLAGPAVGAPMAAICLEKLIALGARRIIVYGWCGALHPSLRIGQLLIPTAGLSEEGTSQHYHNNECCDDATLRVSLGSALTRAGDTFQQGCIWTTDAVYRETREKVARYGTQGVLAVDMEYTALCAVAAFRGVTLAAVMLVSDELYHLQWHPHLHQKQFRKRSRQVLAKLCALLDERELV